MLALRLKQMESNSSISARYDHSGFQEYYSKLYECKHNLNMVDYFLNNAALLQLKDNAKAYWETDVQEMKVKATI